MKFYQREGKLWYLADLGVHWNFTWLPFQMYGKWKWLWYRTRNLETREVW